MTLAAHMENTAACRTETLTREQFELFYGRTVRALRSYVCRIAANQAIADDILQESYIRLLNAPPMLDAQRKQYLYRTATNLVTDHHRAQSRNRRWWQLMPRREEAANSTVELSSGPRQCCYRRGLRAACGSTPSATRYFHISMPRGCADTRSRIVDSPALPAGVRRVCGLAYPAGRPAPGLD